MMKVIRSQKRVNSSYESGTIPIMPNGDLLTMPIPASSKEQVRNDVITFWSLIYLTYLGSISSLAKKQSYSLCI